MKTIIVFSHLRWDFVYQRPQHLLSRLAKHYHIIFVEEPVHTQGPGFIKEHTPLPNLQVLVPHTPIEGWGFNDEQMIVVSDLVKTWVRANCDSITKLGLWFYTPQALPMRANFLPDFTVFDVMDELSLFDGAPKELKRREATLLADADVVITGGPSLWKEKSKYRPDALCIPSSVDMSHYSPLNAQQIEDETHYGTRLHEDVPRPRIGFFGVIDERLDIELVGKIADANPHWQVIMVGPVVKIDPSSLPQRHNIRWMGKQDYSVLPAIVKQWNVCMLPFALNDSTKFISPTKTLEYMAAEKPIVSTAITDVIDLYSTGVRIANTHEDFVLHIQDLLEETSYQKLKRLDAQEELLRKTSWDEAADRIYREIEQVT